MQYGTRNVAARYNGTFSPTWLVNASFAWGHNNLNDTPFAPNVYQIVDRVQRIPCDLPGSPNADCASTLNPLRGQFTRQGLGYYENTTGNNYGISADTSKTFNFLGSHNLTFGYRYDRSLYEGTKLRSGPNIAVDPTLADAFFDPTDPVQAPINAALKANGTNAAFQFRARGASSCITNPIDGTPGAFAAELYVPGMGDPANPGPDVCPDGGIGINLRQTRGEFGQLNFKTRSNYHTAFVQDSWSMNKYVTLSAGLRWEQQQVNGVNANYTFNDNWSPRIGLTVDPWGNRKTKIFANFGRYTEALPLDIAIRSLSAEFDFADTNWVPPTDGAGHVLVQPDGTIDLSTLEGTQSPANPANGFIRSFNAGASAQATVAFAPGARSEYLDEYIVGLEHEFGNSGVVFSARYTDRRIKRIIEDLAALSPEAATPA